MIIDWTQPFPAIKAPAHVEDASGIEAPKHAYRVDTTTGDVWSWQSDANGLPVISGKDPVSVHCRMTPPLRVYPKETAQV